MSGGMDDAYKMECESRDVQALQRKYATGSAKRAVVKSINEAIVRVVAAKEAFEALDEKVKKAEKGKRAFYEETGNLGHIVESLDKIIEGVERLGVDLKAVLTEHKHHYATDDVDEGCTHCGVRRHDGPFRSA